MSDTLQKKQARRVVAAHERKPDPHGSNGYTDQRLAAHVAEQADPDDVHGTKTYTDAGDAAVQANLDAHVAVTDIHYSDAPADGKQYARQSNAWLEITQASDLVGFYDQTADAIAGGGALDAASNYTAGQYYILTVTGTFVTPLPELNGLAGSAGDRIISDASEWILLSAATDYLSSVTDDTAQGVITFLPAPKSGSAAAADDELQRKKESDDADATVQANLDAHTGNALVHFDDVPVDGVSYTRTNRTWVELPVTSSGLGAWTFAGVGTGFATGPGTFRAASDQYLSADAFRFNRFNGDTIDVSTVMLGAGVGDYFYVQNQRDANAAGLYQLTQVPTQDAGGDVIFAALTIVDAAGVMSGPVEFLWVTYLGSHVAASDPHGDRAYSDAQLAVHTGNALIHFDDVPVDGVPYNRQDRLWVPAPRPTSFAYLAQGGISGAWNTTLKTLTGYSDSNSTLDMAGFLNPSAGYIEIPEAGVWEVQATVTGDQGNDTKEEAMRLWVQYRNGPSGDLDIVLDVFDVATDKTTERAFAFSYKRVLDGGDRVYLAVNATSGMGTFSFVVTSLEVTRIL